MSAEERLCPSARCKPGAVLLGIVGAGGIGQTLSASFSRYDFDFALAILLSIIALVALGEWFSDWARRKLR